MCLVENCTRDKYTRGLCQTHYMAAYRVRKSGQTKSGLDPAINLVVAEKFGSKTCSECELPVHGKGLCGTHYARLLRARRKQNASV